LFTLKLETFSLALLSVDLEFLVDLLLFKIVGVEESALSSLLLEFAMLAILLSLLTELVKLFFLSDKKASIEFVLYPGLLTVTRLSLIASKISDVVMIWGSFLALLALLLVDAVLVDEAVLFTDDVD
jgi:hypothetical protein